MRSQSTVARYFAWLTTFAVLGLWVVASGLAFPGPNYQVSLTNNWNAIAYQFSGVKRVTTDLGLVPQSGDQMEVFDLQAGSYAGYSYLGSAWSPSEPTLAPGQGALYYSQRVFKWTVFGAPNVPVLPLDIQPGATVLIACQTNVAASFDQIVGYPAPSGTMLYRLIPGSPSTSTTCPSCFLTYSNVAGIWQPATPIANVGEPVFIALPAVSPTNYPDITSQPQSQTVECGSTAAFSVGASGAPPLYYQWLSNGFPILDATSSELMLSNVTSLDAADYSVIVSNSYGQTNSFPAFLSIQDTIPPTLYCPSDITVEGQDPSGAIVYYTVTATDNCSTPTVNAYPPSGSVFPPGTTVVQCSATDGSGNSRSCFFNVTVTESADLGISITGSPDPLAVSNDATYSVAVTNFGPGLASNAVATVYLPSGISYNYAFSSQGTVSVVGNAVTCQMGYLGPGSVVFITIGASATEPSIQIFTTATVSSDTDDPNLENNGAAFLSTILPSLEVLQPFWFESTIVTNQQLLLTLAGPSNQNVSVDVSTDLTSWSYGFDVYLGNSGIGTTVIPLNQLPGGVFYRARYTSAATPPSVTLNPQFLMLDAGQTAEFDAQASGTPPLTYQWNLNGTNLTGENDASLILYGVTAADAGSITLTVSNAGGTAYAFASLSVTEWNYGIAPDPPYPTLLASGGARHQVVPGFFLGASESSGLDAEPEPADFSQLNPLPPGNDGVGLPAVLVPNQVAAVQVFASSPGMLDAWVDFYGDGNWTDAGDQIFTSQPLAHGRNILYIMTPSDAAPGQSWARFRFSSSGGLSFSGDASDGEVEDYPITISVAPDLTLTVAASPDPVAIGGQLTYLLTVTNSGLVPAFNVALSDVYPAAATSVVCSSSIGACVSNNGAVIAAFGELPPGSFATVNITVSPGAAGVLSNFATVSSDQSDANPSDNSVGTVTTALIPPYIINPPSDLNLHAGDSGTLTVIAGGSDPLGYQWFFNGTAIPLANDADLTLYPADATNAGSYTVVVSNAVGSVPSLPALVTVQLDYIISATAEPGGSVDPFGDTIVSAGADLTYTAAPDPGYTVDSWLLDGSVVLTNALQLTLSNIQSSHSLSVTFDNPTNRDVVTTGGNWYYNTNGVDLGTSWRQPGYDFSSWSNGPALFAPPGYASLYPIPLGTAMDVGSQTTFYFLTQFAWLGGLTNAGLVLTATNYITSGAVFYLNGVQVGQLRMTNDPVLFDSTSLPQNNPGQPEVLTFPASALVTGTNTIAVEVHQSNPSNPNVAFAMNLNAQQTEKATVSISPTELTLSVSQFGPVASGKGGVLIATGLPAGGNYQWSTSTNGIPAAQQSSVNLVAQRTPTNSIASVSSTTPGTVNVQVQYTVGSNAPSEVATCVVNVIQTLQLVGSTNGTYSVSGSARLFNPSPIVVLNDPPDPGPALNPQISVSGTVTSFIAPIAADHIFINGVTAASAAVVSDGPNGLGPFVRTFTSQTFFIGDDDFSVTAAAVNALNNIGYDSLGVTVNRNADGTIASRSITNYPSVPAMPTNLDAYLAPYRCRIQVTDAKRAALTNTATATVNTGVDTKTVTLTNVPNTAQFTSQDLYYVPINLALPGGVSAAVAGARIKAQFGKYIYVTYKTADGIVTTNQLVPTGVLFVQQRGPMNFVQSGLAADVTAGSRDLPFTIEAGIDTRPGPGPANATVTVTSLDRFQQALPAPAVAIQFVPVQLAGNAVRLTQASTDASSGEFNLYTTISPPILALRRWMPLDSNGNPQPNGNVTPLNVTYRGYVSVGLGSVGETNTEPVAGIGYLLATPDTPTATNLNPPMVESDFLPLFNPSPVVLITSPGGQAQIAPLPATVPLQGQIVNFINPMVQANVTVNGAQVTTLTPDANSPQYGPWRATFSHTFPIDPQMPYQIAGVAVWDNLRNMGLGRVGFTAVGGGMDAAGAPIAITATLPDGAAFITPSNAVVGGIVQSNGITLAAAMSVLRNNQFRIEANPILRGNLNWMFNNNAMTVIRQTDGAGATEAVSKQTYPFDVTTNASGLVKGGGGASTARLVLIPQLATADNVAPPWGAPQVLSFRANPGVFVRASLNNVAGARPALAMPNGALIMRNAAVQIDTVVPGTYADIDANPADISVLLRVGADGFDPASGAGRPSIPAAFNSISSDFSGPHYQPPPRQISRNDLAPPAGAMDRQQWENFPTVAQDITLTRFSSDTTSPLFHLFKWKQAGAATNDQPMTVVSVGTYPGAAQRTAMQVSTADNTGLQFAEPGTWVQLQCAAAPSSANKPVFGANLSMPDTSYTATQTANNGAELNNNFSGHRDFCIQLRERPVTLVSINPGPPTAAPADNFWLRAERTFVNPANDLVPAASSGNQVVAYFDTDPAAGFQASVGVGQAGFYRFPPSGSSYQALIDIGTTGATEAPAAGNVGLQTSQDCFEGLNLPDIAVARINPTSGNPRRALPPGRYWLRPVMLSPTGGGRYVLGRRVSFTVPYLVNFTANANFPGDMNGTYGLISGPNAPPAIPAGLTAAQQLAFQQAFMAQWARLARRTYGTDTSAANRDVYVANTANIRIVHPSIPQPQILDFVVPVSIGGNRGAGNFGGANSLDVLNNLTDETALSAGSGIFSGGFFGAGGAQNLSLFAAFQAPNAPYGALAADTVANLQNALNNGILTMPGPINLATAPRDDLARNAATAMSRSLGRTLAHEVAHTLGLVAPRVDIVTYLGGNVAGAPQARATGFRVGSDWSTTRNGAGQLAHNGQVVQANRVAPGPPPAIVALSAPPAGTTQAVGVLPTFQQAVTARAAGVPVSDCEDLNLVPVNNQNLLMDSGSFGLFPERIETGDSGVTVNPALPAAQVEPRATFLPRNLLQIRAVLPRD